MKLQYHKIKSIISVLQSVDCNHFVLSPGSRNAPIIEAIVSNNNKVYSHIDERCGGYVALGIAKQCNQPIGIVCTSGTAALNLAPAIAEAYYQGVCLIAITADRPIGSESRFESQTINQQGIFRNFIATEISIDLSSSWTNDSITNLFRLVQKAIRSKLPVHINLHLSEPLYEFENSNITNLDILKSPVGPTVDPLKYLETQFDFSKYHKPLIFSGFGTKTTKYNKGPLSFPWLSDPCSPNFKDGNIFSYDFYLGTLDENESSGLQPDLLVTEGTFMLSKNLKSWLKKYPPEYHLHLGGQTHFESPFTSNYEVIDTTLNEILPIPNVTHSKEYSHKWHQCDSSKTSQLNKAFGSFESPFFQTLFSVLNKVNTLELHCGNSMAVRYAAFFQSIHKKFATLVCNRGTSGIDGSISTFLGYACASANRACLLIGDISFFYDNNAFWLNRLPQSFDIIVINNGGGKIFDIISGPEKMEENKKFITTPHSKSVKKIAELHGIAYTAIECEQDTTLLTFDNKQYRIIEIYDNHPSTMSDYRNLYLP